MGTPHRGSDVASWAGTFSRVANAVSRSRSFRTDLLKNLECNSDALRAISRQFVQRAAQFEIKTFIERQISPPLSTLVRPPISFSREGVTYTSTTLFYRWSKRIPP